MCRWALHILLCAGGVPKVPGSAPGGAEGCFGTPWFGAEGAGPGAGVSAGVSWGSAFARAVSPSAAVEAASSSLQAFLGKVTFLRAIVAR